MQEGTIWKVKGNQVELKRMEETGVIEKITEPTEWVRSMLLVSRTPGPCYVYKPDGSLCICLDPRNLNNAIKRGTI